MLAATRTDFPVVGKEAGNSSKRPATAYWPAADAYTVRQWQKDAKSVISGARRRGFRVVVVVQDESIFTRLAPAAGGCGRA